MRKVMLGVMLVSLIILLIAAAWRVSQPAPSLATATPLPKQGCAILAADEGFSLQEMAAQEQAATQFAVVPGLAIATATPENRLGMAGCGGTP